ncbi:MAG: hypothetical protein AAGU14_06830 [Eubacteriaceae bacterium]
MAENEIKNINANIMNLSNKAGHEKKIGQMKELLKDHIGKYKEAGMNDKDIDDYLNLYI